jgi:hypothetical protein
MTNKVVIIKPVNQFSNRIHAHCGDTFREMVDLWNDHGLVDVEHSESSPYCWYGKDRSVLLYDRPNLNWLGGFTDYSLGLFGNPEAPDNGKCNVPWVFWGRSPRLLHEYHEKASSKSFQERLIPSIFLGKIENEVQHSYRDVNRWKDCIHEFHCNVDPNSGAWKYSKKEYLEKLGNSRFGLCLRGFGPKCNREIELLGMGVVPLITPEVNLEYYRPLEENVHYIRVDNPEDVERVVRETSEETWTTMSNACKTWYIQNCSPQGSFEVTQEIVNRYKKPSSICTLCTKNKWSDLEYFMKSVRQFEPNIPIVLLCDSWIAQKLKSVRNVHTIECLTDFSDKNRKDMEAEGTWDRFMRFKIQNIDEALGLYDDTVYMDSDIVLLQPLPVVDTHNDVGLCPHYVKQENCDKYGYYNAGYVYVKSKEFTKWWDKAIDTSKYYDQGCLEDAPNHFSHFEFDMTHDFGWWRLLECDNPSQRMKQFHIDPAKQWITFDNKPLCSVHTHFVNDTFPLTVRFNEILNSMFEQCSSFYKTIHDIEPLTEPKQLTILVQYYNDSDADRQKEIDFCFKQNLQNKWVKSVVHFQEPQTVLPAWLEKHPKFVRVDSPSPDRLTFKRAFEYAAEHLQDELVCVTNADIFMHHQSKWDRLHQFLTKNPTAVAALSRHEYDGRSVFKDNTLQKMYYAHSQDAWLFLPSNMKTPMEDTDFPIGILGCDNAIAHRLVTHGYRPYNLANEYVVIHYDVCRGKNGSNDVQFQNARKPRTDAPEKRGYYLLPEYDRLNLVDVIAQFKLTKEEQYKYICDIMSNKLKINNQ